MANDKSIDRINMEHDIAKKRSGQPRRGTRKYTKAEQGKAEEFIDQAKAKAEAVEIPPAVLDTKLGAKERDPDAKAPGSTRKAKTYDFTAEALREAREGGSGRSWADVAKMLGLPNPGAARKAWADLMGTSHTEARQLTTRAPKGSGGSSRLATPTWDDDTDRQSIVDKLVGARITVKSTTGAGTTEELNVAKVCSFDDTLPDRPAVVLVEGVYHKDGKTGELYLDAKVSTGAKRTIFLDRIVEVR